MPPKRLLFWDFDHTLAWREGGFGSAILLVLEREEPQYAVSREQTSAHLREGFPWHTPEYPHPDLNNADIWWAALEPVFARAIAAQGIGDRRARELSSLVRQVYLSPECWSLYEDTLATLRHLRSAGWTQIVFSNHVPELPQLIEHLGLRQLLDGVLCSADIGYEKPHPQSYAIAWERYGPADRVCMVGDSLCCDVLPPLALGWQAIHVHWQERDPAPDSRAPLSCFSLNDVCGLLCL